MIPNLKYHLSDSVIWCSNDGIEKLISIINDNDGLNINIIKSLMKDFLKFSVDNDSIKHLIDLLYNHYHYREITDLLYSSVTNNNWELTIWLFEKLENEYNNNNFDQLSFKTIMVSSISELIKRGHRFLVEKMIKLNLMDTYHSQIAVEENQIEIVQLLIDNNIYYDLTLSLATAITHGHEELIDLLIHLGADHTNYYVVRRIFTVGHIKLASKLIMEGFDVNFNGGEPLEYSCYEGKIEVIKILLENGADPTINDNEVIKKAAKFGHCEIVKLLINYGADINAIMDDNILKNIFRYKYVDIIDLIIESNINFPQKMDYYLLETIIQAGTQIVTKLLPYLNQKTINDIFNFSCYRDNVSTIQFMVENGYYVNDSLSRPIKYAIYYGNWNLFEYYVRQGIDLTNDLEDTIKLACTIAKIGGENIQKIMHYLQDKYPYFDYESIELIHNPVSYISNLFNLGYY
jgi:ankyrin repeat protein